MTDITPSMRSVDPAQREDFLYTQLLKSRIVWLGEDVRDDNANAICSQLLLLSAEDPEKDIYLYINSPGGSVTAGMAIYDTMQYIPNDVVTVATGLAASMGQFLLASGTKGKRYATPHARVLMHQPSGGIGGNHDLVRQNWPRRLGEPPKFMISGVPEHVDGRMIGITEAAGGRLINRDRMWHYVEGIQNWNPIWPRHGIRILPGPSSMWFDASGKRLPAPLFPGSDTLGQLHYIMGTGYDYSWFILTQSIIKKEFALSGSEQNPDLTGKSWRMTIKRATNKGAPAPVEAFKQHGADFIVRDKIGRAHV